jgi:hypothetical protein
MRVFMPMQCESKEVSAIRTATLVQQEHNTCAMVAMEPVQKKGDVAIVTMAKTPVH